MININSNKTLCTGFILCLLFSCNAKENIYDGQFRNMPVSVSIKAPEAFRTTRDYSIKLGDLKPVSIDAHTVDLYGRPYSYTIFNNIPYRMIGPDTVVYKNNIENKPITTTMLYINPAEHDIKSYKAYADFFAEKWPEVEMELRKLAHIYFDMHLIGIAYVKREDLVQYFKGEQDNRSYYFDISPDGAIFYHEGTPEKNDYNLIGSGLADKVEIPGKIIRIMDTAVVNKSMLRQFKDRHGKSMEEYFLILPIN